jgi:hypothetical protein
MAIHDHTTTLKASVDGDNFPMHIMHSVATWSRTAHAKKRYIQVDAILLQIVMYSMRCKLVERMWEGYEMCESGVSPNM